MKTFKRIIFTLLGLLIAGTVALVGIILYAEYSGNRFAPDSVPAQAEADLFEEESRLAYDDNGNLIELPKAQGGILLNIPSMMQLPVPVETAKLFCNNSILLSFGPNKDTF